MFTAILTSRHIHLNCVRLTASRFRQLHIQSIQTHTDTDAHMHTCSATRKEKVKVQKMQVASLPCLREAGEPNEPVFASVFGSNFQTFLGHPVKQAGGNNIIELIILEVEKNVVDFRYGI